jgi:hypothetical protein
MQVDDGIIFDDASRQVTHIMGAPLEPERVYLTGVLFMVLTGVDNIEPLMNWAKQNSQMFPGMVFIRCFQVWFLSIVLR